MPEHRHPLELLARKLETHANLPEDDRQALMALPHIVKKFEPAAYIVREGDPPQVCAVLVSAFAYRQKSTGEGARQILSIHIPGDAVDFQNMFLDVADHSVQMLTRGEVALIQRPRFQELLRQRPAIAHAILVTLLIESSIFREWVLNVGRRDSRTRLAHVLCEFASRQQARGLAPEYAYELPMTQEQLADALGLTPVHVNRVLKSLEADGLIKRHKRMVAFPDWERMRHLADFNLRYLHVTPQTSGAQLLGAG